MSENYVTQKEFDEYKKMVEGRLNVPKKTVEHKPRLPSKYQLYVKSHFAEVSSKHPGVPPNEIMKKISELWKIEKDA